MQKLKRIENLLLFLTILFLPTQLGRHFWPSFSFVYSLKVDYLSPVIYFWDLLVILLLLIFAFQKEQINKSALNLFLLFIFSQLLSIVLASTSGVDPGVGLVRLEQYVVAGLFGVYLASKKFPNLKKVIFYPLCGAVLFESLLALLQTYLGKTVGFWLLGERTFDISTSGIAKFDFYGAQLLRPYGTFPHPNVLAGFLLISIILIKLISHKKSIWLISTLIAGVATIILTFSRVTILAVFSIFLFFGKRWILLTILLVVLFSPLLYTRYSSIFSFDDLTFLRREQLAEISLNLFKTSPIFGIGLNRFIPEAADQILIGPSRFLQPVHNIFLLSLSETGILGLVGFLGLISYPIFKLVRLKSFLLLAWGAILFMGLFDHYFLTLPQGIRLLFLVWGISFCMLEWINEQSG